MADVKDELFLDLLTKEEREALLNIKMEEIKKKNELLRQRHQEIEADKKYAAKQKVIAEDHAAVNKDKNRPQKTPSPRKDFMPLPGDDKKPPISKPSGRGRGRVKREELPEQRGDFRVIRWEFSNTDDKADILKDEEVSEEASARMTRGSGKFQNAPAQRKKPYHKKTDQNKFNFPQLRQDMPNEENDEDQWEPRNQDFRDHKSYDFHDRRNQDNRDHGNQENRDHKNQDSGDYRNQDNRDHRNQENRDHGNQENRDHRNQDSGDYRNHGSRDHRNQTEFGDHRNTDHKDFVDRRKSWNQHDTRNAGNSQFSSPSAAQSGRGRLQESDEDGSGPPPDPSYNFLSDRRREQSNQDRENRESYRKDSRRHPKNFGGQDFGNVPAQMRERKERQERPKSGPPRTKMEMSLAMTGRERIEYSQWKEERDRIDNDRLARQKSQSGEWRRAWDAEKNQQDFDEASNPQRTEPAKRPAGRIGSGRFDRGERDERHRVDGPAWQKGVKQDLDQLPPKPSGRGRARGRGRGRGRSSPRPRTFSGGDETRKVECQKDLLVVKIDNTGKEQDHSVEVEYWDDDLLEVRSTGSGPRGRAHPVVSHPKKVVESDALPKTNHTSDVAVVKDQFIDSADDVCKRSGERTHSHSLSLSAGDDHDESWEDCPDSAEFYGTTDDETKSQSSHKDFDKSDNVKERLTLNTRLNPDAAIFQPSPPDSGETGFMPTSPDFMKTPPGHVKVMDWVSEVTDNLSPTSPPPMEGYNIRKDDFIPKNLFTEKVCQKELTAQSSSFGVTETISHTSSIEKTSFKNLEQVKAVVTKAPILDSPEEEGCEIFEIAPEHGEGTSDTQSKPEPIATLLSTDQDVTKSNLASEENCQDKSMDDKNNSQKENIQNTDQTEEGDVTCSTEAELQEDDKSEKKCTSTQDDIIEEADLSRVPDTITDDLPKEDTHTTYPEVVQDSTQSGVCDEEATVDKPLDDNVCNNESEQNKIDDSSEAEMQEDKKSCKESVPSPNNCDEDTDNPDCETETTHDGSVSHSDPSQVPDTKDDRLSEPNISQQLAATKDGLEKAADESVMEQKSSKNVEGPDKEPSSVEDGSATESPLSS